MTTTARTQVTQTPAAAPEEALEHFSRRLAYETDCADVQSAIRGRDLDFVLVDVRSRALFEAGHVPGAVSIPRAELNEDNLARYAADTTFVVYCAGPHCNGANKAAVALAQLGRPVKEMIGGMVGWREEGFDVAQA